MSCCFLGQRRCPIRRTLSRTGIITADAPTKGKGKDKKEADRAARCELKEDNRVSTAEAVDVALFGRMLADMPEKNQNAACQVAHAISTHSVEREFDFYTAVDDLKPEDTAGADMMGTVEFNSACFYRYAVVDWEKLVKNLQDDTELAAKGCGRSWKASWWPSLPANRTPLRPTIRRSSWQPDWEGIGVQGWLAEADPAIDLKDRLKLDSLKAGQRFRFRLRANPTVNRQGKRLGLLRLEEQEKWIVRKGEQHGFSLPQLASFDFSQSTTERVDVRFLKSRCSTASSTQVMASGCIRCSTTEFSP